MINMNKDKIILSLFDLTGTWSEPYKKNGYEVIRIDIQNGIDILEWDYSKIDRSKVYGILASVPCTDYAVSGARWFAEKDKDGRTEQSQKLVNKTKEIIEYFNPKFWVIENPISRIHNLNPWMGKPKMYFHPYEFANYGYDEFYSKKTSLWGKFNEPVKIPLKENQKIDNTKIHYPKDKNGKSLSWGSIEASNVRSVTPRGFAKAFYEVNK